MKERFYSNLSLEKDLRFCKYIEELRNHPGVVIISLAEECLVHEMKTDPRYGFSRPMIDTGKTHVGYDMHYVFFYYRGKFWYMQPGEYYPFTNDNFPGEFNFIPYIRSGKTFGIQADYYNAYEGIASLDMYKPHGHNGLFGIKGASARQIDWRLPNDTESLIDTAVYVRGGYREREIWNDPIVVRAETWNNEHKVVNVYAAKLDEDGHRDSFAVDLVTGSICG